jgi:hypothetical protein
MSYMRHACMPHLRPHLRRQAAPAGSKCLCCNARVRAPERSLPLWRVVR